MVEITKHTENTEKDTSTAQTEVQEKDVQEGLLNPEEKQTQEDYVSVLETTEKNEPELPKTHGLAPFFDERTRHRNILLYFSLAVSSLSLIFLVCIVTAQGYLRYKVDANFEIISEKGLQIIAVAIFGQVFGVIYIIAKSLWSNDEFGFFKDKDR